MAQGKTGGLITTTGSVLLRIGREIGKEAVRHIRGFQEEFRGQVTGGWGYELARQISGRPRRRLHRYRHR